MCELIVLRFLENNLKGLGDRIRTLRGSLSQESFARQIGISSRALFSYEHEERIPGADVASRICAITGAAHKWLLTGQGPVSDEAISQGCKPRAKIINIDPAVQLVNEAIEEVGIELTETQKNAVVDIVREELINRTADIARAIKGA